MSKRRELTDFERGEIIGLFKGDIKQSKIVEILGHSKSTVSSIIKKYNEKGLTTTTPRSGRPKILSECDNRHLVKIAKEHRSNTLEELTENFNTVMNISVSSR